ncbi:hypothetical protein KEJ27_04855 [Candidatus Bathyarchaeota archaeon]|nr:hypothetical protein [Candidatus Bathyarchaeota archaeon]MBS7614008.1 hypothetical protein [Candidatus Bathyarchaeota archaeon]
MESDRRVRIKLKYQGVEAEIECGEEQVKKAVEEFLSAFQSLSLPDREFSKLESEEIKESIPSTCRGVLLNLWKAGWFNTGRTLGDVHEELSKRGFHYDRTAVAHTLADLVRSDILHRGGRKGRYVYFQKKPPSL